MRMLVSVLLVLASTLLCSTEGLDMSVVDYREVTIDNTFNKNTTNTVFNPSLEVASLVNTSISQEPQNY